jgi:DNA-binding NtrC family response regulator
MPMDFLDVRWIVVSLVAALTVPIVWGVGHELWDRRGGRRARILVVTDVGGALDRVVTALWDRGYRPHTCQSHSLDAALRRGPYRLVLGSVYTAELDARALLAQVTAASPDTRVLVFGDPGDRLSIQALAAGAWGVLDRRAPGREIVSQVKAALQARRTAEAPGEALQHPA